MDHELRKRGTSNRADPFAPLTSQQLAVGDSHEIYVETVGRADGIPAIYLHGGPGSGLRQRGQSGIASAAAAVVPRFRSS